jgi:hypothetical protein
MRGQFDGSVDGQGVSGEVQTQEGVPHYPVVRVIQRSAHQSADLGILVVPQRLDGIGPNPRVGVRQESREGFVARLAAPDEQAEFGPDARAGMEQHLPHEGLQADGIVDGTEDSEQPGGFRFLDRLLFERGGDQIAGDTDVQLRIDVGGDLRGE